MTIKSTGTYALPKALLPLELLCVDIWVDLSNSPSSIHTRVVPGITNDFSETRSDDIHRACHTGGADEFSQ